jgi:hypothetical protein
MRLPWRDVRQSSKGDRWRNALHGSVGYLSVAGKPAGDDGRQVRATFGTSERPQGRAVMLRARGLEPRVAGNSSGRAVVRVDVGRDGVDAVAVKPLDHRLSPFAGQPLVLPCGADDPRSAGRPRSVGCRDDGGLHGADRVAAVPVACDPVEPDMAWLLGAGDEAVVARSEFIDGGRAAADELVQPIGIEHVSHLCGVVDSQRGER